MLITHLPWYQSSSWIRSWIGVSERGVHCSALTSDSPESDGDTIEEEYKGGFLQPGLTLNHDYIMVCCTKSLNLVLNK